MTGLALVDSATMDTDAILRHLGLKPGDTATQALLLVCQRYSLDPLLKHVVLITGKPYITRDGYLHIAHQSGKLDGIQVVDEGQSDTHWTAKVSVFRKDMSHAFTYSGRYPFVGQQKVYGPEMALKCAEVMALRRAFDVTGAPAVDEAWDTAETDRAVVEEPLREELRGVIAGLDEDMKGHLRAFCDSHRIPRVVGQMNGVQVDEVLAELRSCLPAEAEIVEPQYAPGEEPM